MSFSTKIMFLRVKRDNLSCHLQLDDRFLQTTRVMFVHFTGFISTLFNNTCDHIQKSWRGADLHFGRRNNGDDDDSWATRRVACRPVSFLVRVKPLDVFKRDDDILQLWAQ